ncbi:MAG: RdgB/HAM1 family non-canonical purine NTP pyrophosphatase [Spirochaetaceae bacterium]|jgi:XTP/dITP diphosphohydrolase|nr:RdgB/HAM1 family non-canonical purine NTP pyrophosphatase [Spirochaetaceae bacterium]
MVIWFATGNAHKKNELAAILSGYSLKIPADAGITDFDPPETGTAFLENALIKARSLYRMVQEPVIADDSGLCVDALAGRPGIYSARYGNADGAKLSSPERNALILKELGDNPQRNARFVCAMVLLLQEDRFYAAQETLEGTIIREARGVRGFGYDPIFYLPEQGCTVAELSEDAKNRISHRGKAGRAIRRFLS